MLKARIPKFIISLCLTLALSFGTFITSFAATNNQGLKPGQAGSGTVLSTNTNLAQPTEKFLQVCNEYFAVPSEYKVLDKTGCNISKRFYDDNVNNYNVSNIDSIWEYAKSNVSMVIHNTVISSPLDTINENSTLQNGITPLVTNQTKTVRQEYYVLETGDPKGNFDFSYHINGSFVYNIYTGVISSYSGPYIGVDYCSLHGYWSWQMENATTRGTISSDKYSVTFYGSFYMYITFNDYITIYHNTLGHYSNSFVSSGDVQ